MLRLIVFSPCRDSLDARIVAEVRARTGATTIPVAGPFTYPDLTTECQ